MYEEEIFNLPVARNFADQLLLNKQVADTVWGKSIDAV